MKCNFFTEYNERMSRLKEIIMPLLRSEFEEFEHLFLPAIPLAKSDMIQDIKRTDPTFSIPSSIAEDHDLSIHYVAMRYILKNSSEKKVVDFKKYLYNKDLEDDTIARIAGIFYKRASSVTHNVLGTLSLSEIEMALKLNGIEDASTVTVVKTLYAVKRDRTNELN